MKPELWTVADVAKRLKTPKSWVYSHVAELPHFKVGALLRFDPQEIEAWFERQHAGPSGKQPKPESKSPSIQ